MKKPVEKAAMALAIAFIIALVVSAVSQLKFSSGITSIYTMSYAVIAIVAVIVRIGCGWWLYHKTKPKEQHQWLWCLLGAVFGLMAVATYYIVEIYKKVSTPEENRQET